MRDEPVLGVCPEGEFFGREVELEYVLKRAAEAGKAPCAMYLLGRRYIGKTEVLRRAYNRLFFGQTKVVPVYYQFKNLSPEDFAEDYLKAVIKQCIAFLGRAPGIAREEVSFKGLRGLVERSDMEGILGLISRHTECRASSDHLTLLRNALSAPRFVSARLRVQVFLILDDLDLAPRVFSSKEEEGILKEYAEELLFGAPFIASGRGAKVLEGCASFCGVEIIPLQGLKEDDALSLMVRMCGQYNIDFDTEVLTFAVHLTGGAPVYIKNIVWAAARGKKSIKSLRELVELYVGEVVSGNTAMLFRSAVPIRGLEELKAAYACSNCARALSEEEIKERLGLEQGKVKDAVESLAKAGLVEAGYGLARWAGDRVVKDFAGYVYETEVRGRKPEEAKTDLTLKRLSEGFEVRGGNIRGNLKEETAELLKTFNGQTIPKAVFKGRMAAASEEDEIRLPYIAGCFEGGGDKAGEEELSVLVAQGFHNTRYDDKNRVTWVVGVKDAMVPASSSDAEDFIRRADIVMERFGVTTVARWIVSREGFTREAASKLGAEGIWTTDMDWFKILKDAVVGGWAGGKPPEVGTPLKEFEMTLPMKARAELVAAATAGEIATEMGFDEDSMSGIKMAVIEACINAFEHSRLKFGSVRVRFVAGEDGLAVYVENSGRVFDRMCLSEGYVSRSFQSKGRRRGWGMEMMKGLMDSVTFEKIKGGTRLVMVKKLRRHGGGDDGEKG